MQKVIISSATMYDIPLVIDLQIQNHRSYLPQDQQGNGYVSLLTPSTYLQKINYNKQILIARYAEGDFQGLPAGYLIWIDKNDASENPFLEILSKDIRKNGLDDFAIVAQIGTDTRKAARRSGIGSQLYSYLFKEVLPHTRFRNLVTEVSTSNQASMEFHAKMGFEDLHEYTDSYGNRMKIILKKVNVDKENY